MKYLKKALPHIVAIVIFAAISALFFAPQYSGKALRQSDMVQTQGMGQDIVEHQEQYGEHPQWAGRMFSGMPAYLVNMNYEGRWIKNIADYTYVIGQPASYLFLAMTTFYIMLLMFGVNPWISMVGGVAYGLSTYFPIIIAAGHITKMMALSWIPGVVGSVYYAYNKNWLLGAALAGIFLSIEISTSHPQITYYFGLVIVAMFINEFIKAYKEKLFKKFTVATGALMVAAALAIGSNAVQLYYVADYSKETIRSKSELSTTNDPNNATSGLDKDYATNWSYGKAESFNMFIPNFEGGSGHSGFKADGAVAEALRPYKASEIATQLPGYHGSQPSTDGPVYIGAVMIFLMVFGLFVIEARKKWWIVAISVLALMLAWGHNMMWLSDLFLDYFPMYNKFRTVSMILVVLEWSIPLLAILALQKLWNREISAEKFKKALMYSLGITGGFALLTASVLPGFMDFSNPVDKAMGLPDDVILAMWAERESILRSDALRSLLFVLLTAGAVWLFFKEKIKGIAAIAIIGILTTVDLYSVDRRYLKPEDFEPKKEALAIVATEADKQILEDKSDYRVANFTVDPFRDATTSYFHRSIGGYHAAKLRRYQDIIEHHLSENNMAVYNMLNTKYFITKDGVKESPNAAGSAWFVPAIRWVDDPDQEIKALGENFAPHAIAIVDKRFENEVKLKDIQADSTSYIFLDQYKVNHLTYEYSAEKDGVVVFSEIYYPKGWTAYIDGKEVPYFRANYILRAMEVPAGSHKIEWKFAAPHFDAMVATTKASSAILLILAALGIFVSLRKKNG